MSTMEVIEFFGRWAAAQRIESWVDGDAVINSAISLISDDPELWAQRSMWTLIDVARRNINL